MFGRGRVGSDLLRALVAEHDVPGSVDCDVFEVSPTLQTKALYRLDVD